MVMRGGEGGREDGLNGRSPAGTVAPLGLGLSLLLSSPTEGKLFRPHPSHLHRLLARRVD